MLRMGEDESRPPKREQGGSETAPTAGATLPLPSPRRLSTTRRCSKQPAPLGRGESRVQRWGAPLPACLRGAQGQDAGAILAAPSLV